MDPEKGIAKLQKMMYKRSNGPGPTFLSNSAPTFVNPALHSDYSIARSNWFFSLRQYCIINAPPV